MTIRTTSQLVFACNATKDVTNLATTIVKMWKKFANGSDNLYLDYDDFSVQVVGVTEDKVKIKIVMSLTTSYEVPDYYDVDDDMFSDSFGSSNICGYTMWQSTALNEKTIEIPQQVFFMTEQEMAEWAARCKTRWDKQRQEEQRKCEIASLEKQLEKLKKA